MADPNKSPEKLWKAVSDNSEIFKKLSQHPEFTSKLHDVIAKFTEATLNSMEVARPEIDKVNDKISEIITKVGNKSASTVEMVVHNMMTGIFKAIPVVGTIIAALDAGDRVAEGLMTKFGDTAGHAAGGVMPYLNLLNSVSHKSMDAVLDLQKSLGSVMNEVSHSVKSPPISSTKKHSGGRGRIMSHKLNRNRKKLKKHVIESMGLLNDIDYV